MDTGIGNVRDLAEGCNHRLLLIVHGVVAGKAKDNDNCKQDSEQGCALDFFQVRLFFWLGRGPAVGAVFFHLMFHPFHFVRQCGGLSPEFSADPGQQHGFQGFLDAFIGAGHPFRQIFQRLSNGGFQIEALIFHGSGQLYEDAIQGIVINQIVTFLIQLAIDIT